MDLFLIKKGYELYKLGWRPCAGVLGLRGITPFSFLIRLSPTYWPCTAPKGSLPHPTRWPLGSMSLGVPKPPGVAAGGHRRRR